LLTIDSNQIADLLERPTLIHLPGQRPDRLFVSILLHGNEDVGLRAVQQCLHKYRGRPLPRGLSLFIGNVTAARAGVRRLPDQPDYNRVWPGSDHIDCPEAAIMRHVLSEMRRQPLFASIDLHNNTGWNPHYACVSRIDWRHLQLAAMFSRTAVYFQRPLGVQTHAFADLAPSLTCECGKVGDPSGVQHAAELVDSCLNLSAIPDHPIAPGDLHLFHTFATITIPQRVEFGFDDAHSSEAILPAALRLRGDLERLNFQELEPGTELGRCHPGVALPLLVADERGHDVTEQFISVQQGVVRLEQPAIPAMLTCNQAVIRQDCLGYLMERFPLSVPE
jgi:hypothetical protein